MNELWVARDGRGTLAIFERQPKEVCEVGFLLSSGWFHHLWNDQLYPDLLPGQCRRLVMESEVGE